MTKKVSTSSLFHSPPKVSFEPEEVVCTRCDSDLKVRKTDSREVVTLHIGRFQAAQTIKECDQCHTVYDSRELASLVAPSCNFGYDVMVHIGNALFMEHQDINQVRGRLREENVMISSNEISVLGKKFIAYLAIAHRQSSGRIKELMDTNGGYILHLDGTCDRGRDPFLFSGLDSISDIVLGNVKIPTEKAEHIIPLLEQIKKMFGDPLALVRDMSVAISRAIETVFPKKPDFICHYHFLSDIGSDLLEDDYAIIRKRLKKQGITAKLRRLERKLKEQLNNNPDIIDRVTPEMDHPNLFEPENLGRLPLVSAYTLIQWILDGKNQGQGYGFPFDRVHGVFTQRLYDATTQIQAFKEVYLRDNWRDNKPLWKLSNALEEVCSDKHLRQAIDNLQGKANVFDQLRDAMRIAPQSGTDGLNSDGGDEEMDTIKKGVEQFRQKLTSDPKYIGQSHYKKMIAQMDKYWAKLFADPILVDTPNGKVTIYPQRTNNIMERFFRDFKRGDRKKTGNHSISRTLQAMLADTPLVRNLKNADYLKILLDGCQSLEERFARIEAGQVRDELHKAKNSPEKIPAKIKKLIAQPQFLEIIARLFKKRPEST